MVFNIRDQPLLKTSIIPFQKFRRWDFVMVGLACIDYSDYKHRLNFSPKKHWMQIISGIYHPLAVGACADAGTFFISTKCD